MFLKKKKLWVLIAGKSQGSEVGCGWGPRLDFWTPLGQRTTTLNQGSFASFFFALYFIKIVVLLFVGLHLNKEFSD